MFDFLIVGSGLYGATFAYRAKQNNKKCLVIEKREHLGGNVFCENVNGINVHKYGAHIFHTNNKDVWDFVNSLVPFNNYINSPLANYKGKLFNLPFNMNTFNQMWGVNTPKDAMDIIDKQRNSIVTKLKGKSPSNLEEQALSLVGEDIFVKLIKEYTEKQWGRDCKELPPFIIKRLPIRMTFNNNYFNDLYQGIPIGGYNALIQKMLKDVKCLTNIDFFNSKYKEWQKYAKKLVYTAPLDEYFNYKLGELEWRSLDFQTSIENIPNYQGNAVINYTSHEVPYTRIIEHKHFEFIGDNINNIPFTIITKEYPIQYKKGLEKYYPINNDKNNQIAIEYKKLALNEKNVIFGGRLAEYKYYDMDDIIEQVFKIQF